MRSLLRSKLVISLVAGLALGLALSFLDPQMRVLTKAGLSSFGDQAGTPVRFVSHGLDQTLPREDMIDRADMIFIGRITDISPSRWNQDSGEYWADEGKSPNDPAHFQLYQISAEVIQLVAAKPEFASEVAPERQVTVTVIGTSPVDSDTATADDDLQVGSRVVFFLRQGLIGWREGGRRPAWLFVSNPGEGAYVQQTTGQYRSSRPNERPFSLEELIDLVAQRRAALVQP